MAISLNIARANRATAKIKPGHQGVETGHYPLSDGALQTSIMIWFLIAALDHPA
jgi:hypothetical protein